MWCEADVAHERERGHEGQHEKRRAQEVRHTQIGCLCDETAGHGASEHCHAFDDLASSEHIFEPAALLRVSGKRERVHQPRVNGA